MNMNRLIIILTSFLIMAGLPLLGGCGSGGNNSTPPSTTTFKLTVAAATVPTGTVLGTLHATITVPAGVEIRTSATGQVLDGLITAAGSAATGSPQTIGNYSAVTRQLTFDIITPSGGFGNGECAVISFDETAGTTVTAANFTVVSVQGKDYTTAATVSGVTIAVQ